MNNCDAYRTQWCGFTEVGLSTNFTPFLVIIVMVDKILRPVVVAKYARDLFCQVWGIRKPE